MKTLLSLLLTILLILAPIPLRAATITKTVGTSLLTLQTVSSNTVLIGSGVSVSTKLAATVFIHFGRESNTALTEGVFFRVEGRATTASTGQWYPLATAQSLIAAVTSQAVNGTCNASQGVIAMTATAGMSADPTSTQGQIVFVMDSTLGNSEFQRVKTVTTNTSITLEENLQNACTGGTVFPAAEMYVFQLDLTAIDQIRVVVNANNTGQAVAVEAFMVTGDSIG